MIEEKEIRPESMWHPNKAKLFDKNGKPYFEEAIRCCGSCGQVMGCPDDGSQYCVECKGEEKDESN